MSRGGIGRRIELLEGQGRAPGLSAASPARRHIKEQLDRLAAARRRGEYDPKESEEGAALLRAVRRRLAELGQDRGEGGS